MNYEIRITFNKLITALFYSSSGSFAQDTPNNCIEVEAFNVTRASLPVVHQTIKLAFIFGQNARDTPQLST